IDLNFWDNDAATGGSHVWTALVNRGATTGCQDTASNTLGHVPPGFGSTTVRPNWSPSHSMSGTNPGFMSTIAARMVGGMMGNDPPYNSTNTYSFLLNPYHSASNQGFVLASSLTGCTTGSTANISDIPDISWMPNTDIYGNALNPSLHPYQSVSTTT